jgi:phage-related protein
MNKNWQVHYYSKKDGSMPVKEYIDNLPLRERAKVMAFVKLLEARGSYLPRPYADLLDDGIHELRIKVTGTQTRILYFFCYQEIIVLTNVFEKHEKRVPIEEIELAKESRKDFLARFSENDIRGSNKNEI